MIVIHGLWSIEVGLCLWAESSALPERASGHRTSKAPGARTHPFALDTAELVAVLASSAVGATVHKAVDGEAELLLPSGARGPLDSPDLVREANTDRDVATPGLLPWRVPAAIVDASDGAAVLRDLDVDELETDPEQGPSVRIPVGASVRFLAAGVALVDGFVERGHVLPAVAEEREATNARWRPVALGSDRRALWSWCASMPPACRAQRLGDAAEGPSAAAVAADMLESLTDAEVRAALDDGPGLLPANKRKPAADERAAESWLRALTGSDPGVRAESDDTERLRAVLTAWHRSGTVAAEAVRACFRLVAPEDTDRWRVDLLLQDREEPSSVVSAEEVRAGADSEVSRRVDDPTGTLSVHLERAGRLWPRLREALRARRPDAVELDTAEAHEFLRAVAPLLSDAGFGVLLPSWWSAPEGKLGVRLSSTGTPAAAGVAQLGAMSALDAIVNYQWRLALDGDELTDEELDELARVTTPLVRMRGRWVELDRDKVAAGLKLMSSGGASMTTARDVLAIGIGLQEAPGELPVVGVEAEDWLGDLIAGSTDRSLTPIEAPPGFTATLRPYQQRGLSWLALFGELGLGAILADDMGLGKTIQLLALEAHDRREIPRGPTLLVCPTSLVGNWRREAQRFAPGLTVHVHHGADRVRGPNFVKSTDGADLVVTTYGLAAKDAEMLRGVHWRRVVLDEAQQVKNSASKQAVAVRSLGADQRVALTGTPVENRLAELWSVVDFTNPGILGTLADFRSRFAVPIERHGCERAAATVQRVTGSFVLRRLKTDPAIVPELPTKNEMTTHCTLTREQAALYRDVVDDMLTRIESSDGMERKGLVLATMSKLKQVCNHPAHLLKDGSPVAGRSGKLARLEETLDEALADGDRVLCFTQFTEFAEMLRGHLVDRFGREVLYLHGGVAQPARDEMVRRFQSGDGPSIFLLSLRAGGTGLNLTAASHVIHVDRWWNPAVEDQATDRAFRIGQDKNVQVRKFVCVGTLEERIDAMIEEKKALARMAVESGENWVTELSTSQLREVLTLSDDAVAE
ncbi:non-specific serine/threonine protein kinase [Saccharopolyspora lacisalsi]|uniref:Non-specific serine/threonine protein kinase n=1 Tax=Halosaccharopolyspora lacisalsi TaxID=1000566 RepID=A0A839DVE8_9PSEU|nr:DEAD/DEAH box helicase [Halosaccharopolyspora lacisalsi]MBA8823377.1 non-specific serine/threonine protein kinase [Halosaccharopolyspora lacisalsi]